MFARTTGRLFTGTFKALFSNFEDFLRIVWAWFALIILGVLAFNVLGPQSLHTPGPELVPNLVHVLAIFVSVLVVTVANSSIAVAWHRCLLLGERPGAVHLRVGRRELAYVRKTVLIFLISGVAVIPLSLVFIMVNRLMGPGFGILVVVIGVLGLWLPILMRLMLALPATAVDERLGLLDAFRQSRGLGWPMVVASVGVSLVIFLPMVLLIVIAAFAGGVFSAVAGVLLEIGAQIASVALQIGVLTGGHYILRERQMAQGAGPPAAG